MCSEIDVSHLMLNGHLRIAIVGSRTFTDAALIERCIAKWATRSPYPLTIVSGGARGADSIGETIAKRLGLHTIIHLPDWERYGKSAGFRRNDLIVRDADIVLAFFADGPRSAGTSNTVASALLKGIPVYTYHEGRWYGPTSAH